jgi:UDP-N-acetyl-D-galactosamine dehydrogenase
MVNDPIGDSGEAMKEYGVELCEMADMVELDAIILAVAHGEYLSITPEKWTAKLKNIQGVFIDVKSVFKPQDFTSAINYWSL